MVVICLKSSAEAEPNEQRAHARTRTLLAAHILVEDRPPMLCVVRDMSRHGAKLVLRADDALPTLFRLHLLTRGATYRAQRMWRRGDVAGVRLEREETGAG